MMYQILVTLVFYERGNSRQMMTTNVLTFERQVWADLAAEKLEAAYPANAISATIVKLY